MIDFRNLDVLDTSSKKVQVSHAVQTALAQLGANLKVARLRRKATVASIADRVGVSVSTYKRLEKGDPGVSIAAYFEALTIFGFTEQLFNLAAPALDEQGLIYESMQRAKKGREQL